MNRAELISEIAELTGQPKTIVSETMSTILHTITGAISKGDKVTLVGFGTFERRNRQARTGRNPRTLAPLRIPSSRVPAFRPGQELKEIVNGNMRQKSFAGATKASSKPVAKSAKKTTKSAKGKKR